MVCSSLVCIVESILLAIWCFAIPLYIIVLIVLFRYRKTVFKTSFFKIFISLGIADISYSICVYTMGKPIFWGWYNGFFLSYPHIIGTWSLAWNWQAGFCQLNGVFLFTANRYTAIVHFAKHKKIWTDENTNLFIAIQWILSFVFASPRPFINVGYKFQPDNKSLNYDFEIKTAYLAKYHFKFLTVFVYILCSVVLFMYCSMMRKVYKSSRQVAPSARGNSTANQYTAEMRLAIVGMILAVTLCLRGIYYF